ncbi:DUF5050 domain-containing protein [Clostridium bovifaecis]|uniref:DUF5050 domain-containing protein n=1 Tax=Clostridium bovifaecis TaxID=2184719 RepID=A0A6I6F4J7_9CLOT|nr:DUF5050 domain-containing protein [Clostridium bovifaecis]
MKKRWNPIITLFFIITILVNFTLAYGAESAEENVSANIMNLGYIARDSEFIYYSNIADGSKLYKSKLDGSGETKLSDHIPNYINVVGDWIYYSNVKDGFKIYKIKKDGSEGKRLNSESSFWIHVVNDWIYYGRSDNAGQKLYKIKTDGSDKTRIIKDLIYGFSVVGDWIYYSNESEDQKYKVKTNGENATKLNEDQSFNINVVGGYIYYQNYGDGRKIYKVDVNGKNRTKLNNDDSQYLNTVGEWIYYSNASDNLNLYKIKNDGNSRTKLSNEGTGTMNVIGDYIYYWKAINDPNSGIKLDSTKLLRIKKDGTASEVVKIASEGSETKEDKGPDLTGMILIYLFVGIAFILEVWKLISLHRIKKFVENINGEMTNEEAERFIRILSQSRIIKRSDMYRLLKQGLTSVNSSLKVNEDTKEKLHKHLSKRGIHINLGNKN